MNVYYLFWSWRNTEKIQRNEEAKWMNFLLLKNKLWLNKNDLITIKVCLYNIFAKKEGQKNLETI